MPTIPPEQILLTHDHRLRRWIIRISLLLLLLLVILTVAGFMLISSSGMTATEAEAAFAQLKAPASRKEAEHLLGKPYSEVTEHGITTLSWQYYTQGINHIDVFYCSIGWDERNLTSSSRSIKAKIEGWEAWRWRWNKLKQRLGIK